MKYSKVEGTEGVVVRADYTKKETDKLNKEIVTKVSRFTRLRLRMFRLFWDDDVVTDLAEIYVYKECRPKLQRNPSFFLPRHITALPLSAGNMLTQIMMLTVAFLAASFVSGVPEGIPSELFD